MRVSNSSHIFCHKSGEELWLPHPQTFVTHAASSTTTTHATCISSHVFANIGQRIHHSTPPTFRLAGARAVLLYFRWLLPALESRRLHIFTIVHSSDLSAFSIFYSSSVAGDQDVILILHHDLACLRWFGERHLLPVCERTHTFG